MSLWLELWTRPGDATFGRVHNDTPYHSGGFSDSLNGVGSADVNIPSSWPGFDDVLHIDPDDLASSSVGLFRWYSSEDPTTPAFEWQPTSLLPAGSKQEHSVTASGNGIKGILANARLEPWDWDGTDYYAPRVPDWVFGGPDIIKNGTFEVRPFINGTFENGTSDPWNPTTDNGFLTAADGVTAVNDPVQARTGDWYGLINPGAGPNSGGVVTFSGLTVGSVYQFVGYLAGNSPGERWIAGIAGASNATHLNAYQSDGYWWAELDNVPMGTGSTDGTYQSFTLNVTAGETSITLVVVEDTGAANTARIDDWEVDGEGLGLYPWQPVAPAQTNLFEWTAVNPDTGVGAGLFQATDFLYTSPFGIQAYGQVGVQQPVALKLGQPYTMTVRVRQDSGSPANYILGASRVTPVGGFGSPGSFYMNSQVFTVPSGVYTTLSITFTADVLEGMFELRYFGSAGNELSPVTRWDNAHLFEGLPKTTVGDILLQIYRDATLDHLPRVVWDNDATPGTPYLTPDFDETLDSAGQAWADSEIAIRLTMRMSYSQIQAEFSNTYGYEYRIVPDDPEAGTWLWQVYNPGTMSVTQPLAAIQGGAQDTRRSLRRFVPSTDSLVEGIARITARARNATLITALGRREGAGLNREVAGEDGAIQAATESMAGAVTAGASYSYTLVNPDIEPVTGYALGDLLSVVDPPEVDAQARFVGVTYSTSPEGEEWEVQFGETSVTGDAAVASAVEMLLAKFEYPDPLGESPIVQGGGGSGVPRVVLGAVNASPMSQAKSDFLGDGVDDTPALTQAVAGLSGEVRLTEGNFFFDDFTWPPGFVLSGQGWHTTQVVITGDWTFDSNGTFRDFGGGGGAG